MFYVRTQVAFLLICLCFAAVVNAYDYDESDFASEVVSFNGPFGSSPYDDPYSVLGQPTTEIYDELSFEIYLCSLVYAAWGRDFDGNKLVVTLGDGAEIVVKFDHKVGDDPGNPYGFDFIVFGNTFFGGFGTDPIGPDTDMEQFYLEDPTSTNDEAVRVSVAQQTYRPWYTFQNGPYGDTAFPTNAYAWDRENHCWGEELNWLRPVEPNLTVSDFDGLSAADAIDLYNGSAGGTGFDLKDLAPSDYTALAVDPDTGQKWIRYIKVQSVDGVSQAGEIDGFADVAGCGDYKHPHPTGDINQDCRVDYEDMALLCGYWLADTSDPCAPAVIADIYEDEDNIVNLYDCALMVGNWLKCTWECE